MPPNIISQAVMPVEPKPIFEAESPDELALVEMAYAYNCRLTKRTPTLASILLPGKFTTDHDQNYLKLWIIYICIPSRLLCSLIILYSLSLLSMVKILLLNLWVQVWQS